jgi:hypothetical protein
MRAYSTELSERIARTLAERRFRGSSSPAARVVGKCVRHLASAGSGPVPPVRFCDAYRDGSIRRK